MPSFYSISSSHLLLYFTHPTLEHFKFTCQVPFQSFYRSPAFAYFSNCGRTVPSEALSDGNNRHPSRAWPTVEHGNKKLPEAPPLSSSAYRSVYAAPGQHRLRWTARGSMLRISSPTISYCSPWFTPTPRPCSRPIPTSSLVILFLRCCSDNVDGGPQCVFSRDSIAASAFGHSMQTLALYLDMAYFVTSFRHQARTIESTLAYRSRQPHRYLTAGKCSLHTLLNVPQAANRFAVSCKKLFWKPGERGHRDARALPPIMEVNLESRIIAVITNTTSMDAMPRPSVHIKVGWD